MKKMIASKLLRRCLILSVMILGLVYVVSSDKYAQNVEASICCENCDGRGDPSVATDQCGIACTVVFPQGGALWQQCFDSCVNNVTRCYSNCNYCNSNGPGGCNSTGDCPVGYWCGADNTCQRY